MKTKEKRFEIDVDIKWTSVEFAKNKKEAIKQVKNSFDEEYNIQLTNQEIKEVREEKQSRLR